MDAIQAVATSVGVIGLILLMVLLVLHFFGPKTAAWIHSNREEKIGFSKSKLYHANGYLIHSGSEFLLNSTGSFKRFDSIDRDYKPVDQPPNQSPSWNINIPEIPPQPLRPAPKSPTFKERGQSPIHKSFEQQQQQQYEQRQNTMNKQSSVIPRPTTKRQHSSPANCGIARINLSEAVAKITNGPRSCTNPFLNSFHSISEDHNSNSSTLNDQNQYLDSSGCSTSGCDGNTSIEAGTYVVYENKLQRNPFARQRNDETSFFSFPLNGNIHEADDSDNKNIVSGGGSATSLVRVDSGQETVDTLIQLNEPCKTDMIGDLLDIDNDVNQVQQNFRNRSHSDADGSEKNCTSVKQQQEHQQQQKSNEDETSTNPFVAGNLHKTLSDTYLGQYASNEKLNNVSNQTWSFSHSLSRQSTNTSNESSVRSFSNSQMSMNLSDSDLKRATSCDSVNSESSVVLADLEQQTLPTVTGQLCVGLQYDKNTMTDEGIELVLTVMEAKELIGPSMVEHFDTFVRIYLVPDETTALQTKLFKNSTCPSYNETFSFWLNKKPTKRSLWFHLYHSGSVHTLIGETEFQIGDVRRPITTWLTLSDSRHNISPYGELMFSLSYLPTAERLTVVVVKARNLKQSEDHANNALQNIFVKVYLLKDDKKVSKKKTSVKRADSSPIFNESMIFSVPPYMLKSIHVRLTVCSASDTTSVQSNENSNINNVSKAIDSIGHVIVGCSTSGKGSRHWNQMLTSLRKPVAMWHAIRQTQTNSVKTGIS